MAPRWPEESQVLLEKFKKAAEPMLAFVNSLGNRAERIQIGKYIVTVEQLKEFNEYATYHWRKMDYIPFRIGLYQASQPISQMITLIREVGAGDPEFTSRRVKITFHVGVEKKVVDGLLVSELLHLEEVLNELHPELDVSMEGNDHDSKS